MPPPVRKAALATHLTCSGGWIGTILAYLALVIAAVTSDEAAELRPAWRGLEVVSWYVIVPLAVGSLLTGLLMALGTRWGLLRHYWVIFSLVLTAVATGVLLLHMPSVSANADLAQQLDGADLEALGGDLGHPAIGLVLLVVIQLLNVYKPKGLTRRGLRAQDVRRGVTAGVA